MMMFILGPIGFICCSTSNGKWKKEHATSAVSTSFLPASQCCFLVGWASHYTTEVLSIFSEMISECMSWHHALTCRVLPFSDCCKAQAGITALVNCFHWSQTTVFRLSSPMVKSPSALPLAFQQWTAKTYLCLDIFELNRQDLRVLVIAGATQGHFLWEEQERMPVYLRRSLNNRLKRRKKNLPCLLLLCFFDVQLLMHFLKKNKK